MQFFERQNTITRNLQKKSSDNFYKSGNGSAFSSKSDQFDDFEQAMRETKMEFFFADSER